MNKKEIKEFFNQVKGIKIRWSDWSKDEYFIPMKLNSVSMYGPSFNGGVHFKESLFYVESGFYPEFYGDKWEYFLDMDKELNNI